MPEPYNLSITTGGNSLLNILQASNSYTDSTFGALILVCIWFVVFLRLKVYQTNAALFAASFITSIVAMLFVFMSLVSFNVFLVCVVITGIIMIMGWNNS